jgi:cytochrome c55X
MSWMRIALLGLIPVMMLAAAGSALADDPLGPERQRALRNLLVQDCGSCHGLTLRGGLGPALLPADLADKPPAYLQATILYGRPGTPMPPWRPFLSDADTAWLVETLQRGLNP